MKKNALRGFGAAALIVTALTGCGAAASTDQATTAASDAATPTPTPTAAKQYTNDELLAMIKQIKTGSGAALTVASSEDLAEANPAKAIMEMFTIEPAVCKELSTLGASEPLPGSTSAAGAEVNNDSRLMTSVTLTSGVDQQTLQKSVDTSAEQAATCADMTMSMSGQSMTVKTTKIDPIGTIPGTVAYQTVMATPSGATQSSYMAYVVKDGVLISATASGKGAEANGVASAGALMDQAAALIK